ncbi:MAG: hypothetical protein D6805_07925 [Planctomycetota bacterium]|nr:MAG: hypothetical protein D6805_07925 [Planctomycetota bacterium]
MKSVLKIVFFMSLMGVGAVGVYFALAIPKTTEVYFLGKEKVKLREGALPKWEGEKALFLGSKLMLADEDLFVLDEQNQMLTASKKWRRQVIPLVRVEVKNWLDFFLVNLQYVLEVDVSPKGGVLSVGLYKQGGSRFHFFSQWHCYLKLEAMRHFQQNSLPYKDYRVEFYLLRSGGKIAQYVQRTLRVRSNGMAELL